MVSFSHILNSSTGRGQSLTQSLAQSPQAPQVDASYVEEVRRIESRSEQPRAPPAVPCRSNRCNHKVIFGNHFDKDAWQEYVEEDDRHTRQQRENEEQEEEDNMFL